MKYYIVSEEELNELSAAWSQLFLIERAEAACRARPVTLVEFKDDAVRFWAEVKK